MTEDDAARFRMRAEACRKLAAAARNEPDKEAWVLLAEEWLKLAAVRSR